MHGAPRRVLQYVSSHFLWFFSSFLMSSTIIVHICLFAPYPSHMRSKSLPILLAGDGGDDGGRAEGLTFAVHDHEGREYGCSYFDLGKVEEGELQSAFEPYKLKDSDPDEADESEGKEEETADGEDVRLPDVPTEKMVRDQLDKIRPLTDDEFVDDLDDDIEYFCGVFHKVRTGG